MTPRPRHFKLCNTGRRLARCPTCGLSGRVSPDGVQIVHSSRRGSRNIGRIGLAHDDVELDLLKAVARQRLAAGGWSGHT